MPQPYDIQLPDILGQYQRGKDMAFQNERRPIEAQQRDTVFQNTQNDRSEDEIGVIAGLIAAEPTTEGRARVYSQALPKLAPYVQQKYGIQLRPEWGDDLMPEVQHLQQIFSTRRNQNQLPSDIQTMEYYKNNPDQFDRQIQLRRASANPFGFQTVTGPDGVERLVQTNKREGGAAEIGPGGVPQGMGAGPNATPNIIEFSSLVQQFGGRLTSGYRTAEEQAALRAAGKTTTHNSQHETTTGADFVFANPQAKAQAIALAKSRGINVLDEGGHVHFGIPRGVDVTGPNAYQSRPAEQQAALNAAAAENAKISAQVANTPGVAQSEAQIAAAKALAEAKAQGQGERANKIALRTQNAGTALDLLSEAEAILPTATGSGLGSARDSAAAVFGQSTKGAQGAARLKTISGQLILMQPRMEGPQSDADRKLYSQMAGDIGNETLPVATRMAALKGMQKLQEKYANIGKPAAKSDPLVIRYDAQGNRIK